MKNENKNARESDCTERMRSKENTAAQQLSELKFQHVEVGQQLEVAEAKLQEWDRRKANLQASCRDLALLTLRLMLVANDSQSLRTSRAALQLASNAKNLQWMVEKMFLPDEFEEEWRTHDVEVRRLNLQVEDLQQKIERLNDNVNDNEMEDAA